MKDRMPNTMEAITAAALFVAHLRDMAEVGQIEHSTAGNAERSVRAFGNHFGTTPLDQVTAEQIRGWIATTVSTRTGEPISRGTRNLQRVHVRQLYHWSAKHHGTSPDAALDVRVFKPDANTGREEDDRRQPATDRSIMTMFQNASDRDRLIVMIAVGCGLRRAELARMDVSDWDPVERKLRVFGKGRKVRRVDVTSEAADGLDNWVGDRSDGPMWPNTTGKSLTPTRIGQIITSLSDGECTTHQLRHRMASDALAAGATLEELRVQLGHASIASTAVYLHSVGKASPAITERSYFSGPLDAA